MQIVGFSDAATQMLGQQLKCLSDSAMPAQRRISFFEHVKMYRSVVKSTISPQFQDLVGLQHGLLSIRDRKCLDSFPE